MHANRGSPPGTCRAGLIPDPGTLDQHMLAALRDHGIELIVTAGYMKNVDDHEIPGFGPVTIM